jgi:hypothetical protein
MVAHSVFPAILLALSLLLAACSPNPTQPRAWPVTVIPGSGGAAATALPPDCDNAALPPPSQWAGAWHNPDLNLGCATAHNLGAMIAEPHDLVVGRDPGPADGERAVLSIQRYRRGEEKPLMSERTSGLGGGGTGGGPGSK